VSTTHFKNLVESLNGKLPLGWSLCDTLSEESWDSEFADQESVNWFYASGWAQALRDTYNYTPFYLKKMESGSVVAAIPMIEVRSWLTGIRGISVPFSDHCEIYAKDDSDPSMKSALLTIAEARKWAYLDIKGAPPNALRSNADADRPWKSVYRHTLTFDDESFETLSRRFASSTRRAIKKAWKNNVSVEFGSDAASLKAYYRMHCQTRKKNGAPPQPFKWFQALHRRLLSRGNGIIAIARHAGKPISGALFLFMRRRALYKYGASDYRYADLRGSNAVFAESIKWLMKSGYKSLDFGITDLDGEGLRRFKLGWACDETVCGYSRFDFVSRRLIAKTEKPSRLFNIGSDYIKYFPEFALNCAGRLLYKHIA